MLSGISIQNDRMFSAFLGIVVWCVIVMFSTSTTTLSILNTTGTTIQDQIASSPKVKSLQADLDSNNKAIKGKQAQIDGRDAVRWASKRDGWEADIATLKSDNKIIRADTATHTNNKCSESVYGHYGLPVI